MESRSLLNSLELLFLVVELNSEVFWTVFISSPLGLWNLSLHLHAIVNNPVDELRLCTRDMFVRVHVVSASSLRFSLPKLAVALAHRRYVRRFTLA